MSEPSNSHQSKPARHLVRAAWRAALGLALFAAITAGVVAGTQALTAERIAANQLASQYRILGELLPAGLQHLPTNDLVEDTIILPATPALGKREPFTAWRVRRGEHAVLIVPVTAHGGYSGDIELLVGIDQHGQLSAVRVVEHRETPGLGDKIERRKSDWITGFDNRSLDNPSVEGWAVSRDGGEFDSFTGATITPRAVTGAVRQALQWFTFEGLRLLSGEVES